MSAGRILQTGSPEECYLRPVSLAAARLLGEAEDLPARIENGVAHTAFGTVPAPGMVDGAARVMLRQEALYFDPSGVPAEVVNICFAGSFHTVTLSSGDAILTARTAATPPPVGTRAGVSLDPMRTAIYQ
jgi:iron(III) transport system ATP-binding protein